MKTWIASACLALALAAGTVAATPASANHKDKDWNNGFSWNGPDWNGGPGWNNGWGWNGGQLPWLGYNNPTWPTQPRNCDDLEFRNGRWVCDDNDWRGDHDKHDKYVSQNYIAQKIYHAGYRQIFDIDRDGSRYKVKAIDRHGRHVLLTFNARTGDFIKKKFL